MRVGLHLESPSRRPLLDLARGVALLPSRLTGQFLSDLYYVNLCYDDNIDIKHCKHIFPKQVLIHFLIRSLADVLYG